MVHVFEPAKLRVFAEPVQVLLSRFAVADGGEETLAESLRDALGDRDGPASAFAERLNQ